MSALPVATEPCASPHRSASVRLELWAWAVITVCALLYSLAFIGHRPLADPDEGRYAAAAWTMVESGNWFVPQLQGRPHLTKSPVSYWPSAVGLAWLGRNETGARLGVGLGLALWILVVAAMARVIFERLSAAVVASATLATCGLPFAAGSLVTADIWLALCCALAVTAGAIALLRPQHRTTGVTLFWVGLGVAFLVKGPPGLLPLAGMVLAWPQRRLASSADRFWAPLGISIAALIGSWWYLAMMASQPGAWRVFLHDELYARIFSGQLRRNGPPWLPLSMLLLGTLPWNLVLLFRIRVWRQAIAQAWLRLLGGWVLAGLLVFTLSRSRQPLYVLPLATAVVVPAAGVIASWLSGSRVRKLCLGVLVSALAIFWIVLRYDAAGLPDYRHSRDLARLVAARHEATRDGVVLLQTRPLPGLEFYLGEQVRLVAWKRADLAEPHDFDRGELIGELRTGRRLVVVGRAETFQRFPADLTIVDRAHDRASDMDVAVLVSTPVEPPR